MQSNLRRLLYKAGIIIFTLFGSRKQRVPCLLPGHAMLVADIAEDSKGNRIYIRARSYMPDQDLPIVKSPKDAAIGPWYRAEAPEFISRPRNGRSEPASCDAGPAIGKNPGYSY